MSDIILPTRGHKIQIQSPNQSSSVVLIMINEVNYVIPKY